MFKGSRYGGESRRGKGKDEYEKTDFSNKSLYLYIDLLIREEHSIFCFRPPNYYWNVREKYYLLLCISPPSGTILPSPIILTPIHWDIMRSAGPSKTNHHPRNAPWHAQATTLYVSTTHHLWTIEWAQTSTSSGYLGIQRMIQLLRKALWWPSLPTDFRSYINTWPICSQVHTPYQLLARLLEPFSMPQRPWWHILVDFVTDLTCSCVFTTILIAANQFSKACKLVPLKSQFTAMETLAPLSVCISYIH